MLSPRNGFGLEAKNYGLGLGLRLVDVALTSCTYGLVNIPAHFINTSPTHTGRESVDQCSSVPIGLVVEHIASVAAVVNAVSVHSL